MEPLRIRQAITGILENRHVQFAARLILGGVFVYSGLVKIASPREFARIVVNYNILPENMAIYFAFVLPWLELMLGIFLIIGFWVKKIALALSFLLILFAGAILIRYLNGATAGCGCFSLKSSGPESIFILIGRDVALLACGLYLSLNHGKRASRLTVLS
jgi:uncharacterized membrane protein YphA (DoxX/SURF4 family)